jgi:hypothetical protein
MLKFVDIVVNGISERTYDIKVYSQDPFGVARKNKVYGFCFKRYEV